MHGGYANHVGQFWGFGKVLGLVPGNQMMHGQPVLLEPEPERDHGTC